MRYSLEPKYGKYVQGYGFCHLQENLESKMKNKKWILQQKLEQMLQKLLLKQ